LLYLPYLFSLLGHVVMQLVEALCSKPEGRDFDSRLNRSGRTIALGSTQSLTEMSTRNITWEQRCLVRRTDKPTSFIFWLSANLWAWVSLLEPSGPLHVMSYLKVDVNNVKIFVFNEINISNLLKKTYFNYK